MYETLGIDLGKGYMSEVQSSTGENMDALGQVTCTFKNNGTQFTQAFVVCRNMTQHMILGTDFTATNFVDVIWTREGTHELMDSNVRTIMELPDSTTKVPLVLAYSVKIEPRGQRAVPLECTRKLTDQMDIRIDAGFHHRNPNVHIPPSCVHEPGNAFDPKYIPLTIFNLSHVDHLYIGRDTVVAFADEPTVDMYNVELANEDKIKEHLTQPRNWVPQCHKHCQKYQVTLLLSVQLQMYQVTEMFISRVKKSKLIFTRDLKSCVKGMAKHSPNTMRTLAEQSLSRWT